MSPKRAQSSDAKPGAVWLREPRAPARPQGLTPERIVADAVRLLDREGSAKLSMRKLADSLGVHATSLYWHVSHRDELLDLALDAVFAEVALPAEHSGWREDLTVFMNELRRALLHHPWSAALADSRPLLGPNAMERFEFVYTALVDAGLTGPDLSAAAAALSHYVIGSAAAEASWQRDGRPAAAFTAHLQRIGELYPTLATHTPSLTDDWNARFTRGAEFLLNGFAAGRG